MRDPYSVLGVAKGASQDEIKRAYRKLAKQLHPDVNPGNKQAAERFKDVSAAYDVLGDADRRKRFDRGEFDPAQAGFGGAANGGPGGFRWEWRHGPGPGGSQGANPFDGLGGFGEDLFADLFGKRRRGGGGAGTQGARPRGQDQRFSLTIDFLAAARGDTQRLTLPAGKVIDVAIPAGIETGGVIRLRGQGEPAPRPGGEAGDALIEIAVRPHEFFRREGHDVLIELPVSLREAVLGAKVAVPTIDGAVAMNIPRGANSGQRLRLKGKGIVRGKEAARGDQYVTLKVVLPDPPDADLEAFVAKWRGGRDEDPRKKSGMG